MYYRFTTSTAAVLAAAFLAGHAAAAPAGSPRALVIGNSNYSALPPLPGCAASANTVSAALRRAGFEVTEKSDVSNGEMGSAIRAVANPPSPTAAIVLYICGYAMDYGRRAFLLPASAAIQRDTDALTQGLVAKSALTAAAASGAPAAILLLDAVAAPPLAGTPASIPHFDTLAAPPLKSAFVAALSAAAPPQGASAFAAAIAAAFAKPSLPLAEAVQTIAAQITSPGITVSSGAPEEPAWLAGAPSAPTPAAPPPPPAVPTAQAVPDEAHMTDADRRRIQTALLHLGYYDRAADGIFGPDTWAAIRRFQHEIGADMTGEITQAQSARLLAKAR
jgi:hypothetical protein